MNKAIYQTKYLIKEKNGFRSVVSKILDYLSPSKSSWQDQINHYKKNGDAKNEKIITDLHGVKTVSFDVPGTRMKMIYERTGFINTNKFSPSEKAQYYVKRKNDMSLTSKQRAYAQKRFEELANTGR
jgi:hypothetical protein